MNTFAEIVDAADQLTVDEQESLVGILTRRIAESRRAELVRDVAEARNEHRSGLTAKASVADIMAKIRSAFAGA